MDERDRRSVEELRLKVGELAREQLSDFDFLRWLQGYEYKIDQVVPLINRNCEVLRAVDIRHYEPSDVMRKYWPRGIIGETGINDDNLVFIETLSKVDSDGLAKSSTLFDIIWSMYALRIRDMMDRVRQKEKETGRQWALIHILDLEGLVFDHKLLNLISGHYKILAQLYTDHSVEMNRKIIAVNVPSFLHHLFNLVKCFIPERTRKKFIVLGSNWKEEIHEHARPDCLPVHWGGTLVDPETGDTHCSSCIAVPPGPVDPSFFITSVDEKNSTFKAESKILDVPAWKSNVIAVKVDRPNSKMNLQFLADGDYGFGVFYVPEKNEDYRRIVEKNLKRIKMDLDDLRTIYPFFDRIPGPNYSVEKCQLRCHRAGYYLVYFSNEFSWMSHLKVHYNINVE